MKLSKDNPNSLAAKSGARQPNIFRIIEGVSADPRTSTIQPLAAYWGVSVADLKFKDLTGVEPGAIREERRSAPRNGTVVVPVMDAEASMGLGKLAPEHDAIVGNVVLDEVWIRNNLVVSSPINLSIISGYGNSMEPTFSHGDLLLVDRGVTAVKIDAIYVINYKDELFIKTVQRRPGHVLRVISDNKTYDPWDIDGQDEEYRILGKVVWAWNGKKL